jgi:shikimate kinase
VVALGGGAVLADAAWPALREAGVVLGLQAAPGLLLARLQATGRPLAERPLLAAGDPLERIAALLHQRRHAYARADATLDTTGLDPSQAASALVGVLRGLEGPLARRARGLEGPR